MAYPGLLSEFFKLLGPSMPRIDLPQVGGQGPDGSFKTFATDPAAQAYHRATQEQVFGQPPNPASTAEPGWWNSLGQELQMTAPPIPKPTAEGGRSWTQDIPLGALLMEDVAPTADKAASSGATAATPGPTVSEEEEDVGGGAVAQPTQASDRPTSGYSPEMGMMLLRLGLQMMQPIQPGQTVAGRIGEIGIGGLDYLTALRAQQRKEGREEKKLGLEDRRTTATEEQVRIAAREAKRKRELEAAKLPAEIKEKEASAEEKRQRAELYKRSAGRGSAGQARTREELRAKLIQKIDLSLLQPEDLTQIKQSIDELVAASGLPAQQEVAAKPWPKTWKEAVTELKKSYPNGIPPSVRIKAEAEMQKRYPDYKPGALK